MRLFSRLALFAAAALAATFAAAPAHAGFAVRPTSLYLTDAGGVTTLFITNNSPTSNVYQVGVAEWRRGADGHGAPTDVAPTDDIILSPQVFRLGPGETGRVRIRAARADVVAAGKAYRVLARQVEPPKSGAALSVSFQVQFNLPLLLSK